MPDHVHMLISIPPKYSVAQIIGYMKGKSSIWIAQNVERKMRNFLGHKFWARGYFVTTVGRNESGVPMNEALVSAGQNRLRPIAMTTIAAILTLMPLALATGQGSAMQQPLAVAIISGLTVQLPLVFLVMPNLYLLIYGGRESHRLRSGRAQLEHWPLSGRAVDQKTIAHRRRT